MKLATLLGKLVAEDGKGQRAALLLHPGSPLLLALTRGVERACLDERLIEDVKKVLSPLGLDWENPAAWQSPISNFLRGLLEPSLKARHELLPADAQHEKICRIGYLLHLRIVHDVLGIDHNWAALGTALAKAWNLAAIDETGAFALWSHFFLDPPVRSVAVASTQIVGTDYRGGNIGRLRLTLEEWSGALRPPSTGFVPHPESFTYCCSPVFFDSFRCSHDYLSALGIWDANIALLWHLQMVRPWPYLPGASAGAATALAAGSLLAERHVERKTSAAVAGKEEVIETLASLAPKLERALVTASIDSAGNLGHIEGITDKVSAIQSRVASTPIHAVGVSWDQRDALGEIPKIADVPVVRANDIGRLAQGLDRELNVKERFGQRLPTPTSLIKHLRYSKADFVGRSWLAKEIGEFIRDSESGYVVIAADRNWGKTWFALMWYLHSVELDRFERRTDLLPKLSGWVFCGEEVFHPATALLGLEAEVRYWRVLERAQGQTQDLSLVYQSEHLLAERFQKFLRALGTHADHDKPAVLLVDGVDKIWGPEGTQPGFLLPGLLPQALPRHVFIVLLSRPGDRMTWLGKRTASKHVRMIDVDSAIQASVDVSAAFPTTLQKGIDSDVAAYIDRMALNLEERGAEKGREISQLLRELREQLVERAQGYFVAVDELLQPSGRSLLIHNGRLLKDLQEWQSDPPSIPRPRRFRVARSHWDLPVLITMAIGLIGIVVLPSTFDPPGQRTRNAVHASEKKEKDSTAPAGMRPSNAPGKSKAGDSCPCSN